MSIKVRVNYCDGVHYALVMDSNVNVISELGPVDAAAKAALRYFNVDADQVRISNIGERDGFTWYNAILVAERYTQPSRASQSFDSLFTEVFNGRSA